jgi:hypothetical protein
MDGIGKIFSWVGGQERWVQIRADCGQSFPTFTQRKSFWASRFPDFVSAGEILESANDEISSLMSMNLTLATLLKVIPHETMQIHAQNRAARHFI